MTSTVIGRVVPGLKGAGEGSSLKDYSIGFTPYRLYSAYRLGEEKNSEVKVLAAFGWYKGMLLLCFPVY